MTTNIYLYQFFKLELKTHLQGPKIKIYEKWKSPAGIQGISAKFQPYLTIFEVSRLTQRLGLVLAKNFEVNLISKVSLMFWYQMLQ